MSKWHDPAVSRTLPRTTIEGPERGNFARGLRGMPFRSYVTCRIDVMRLIESSVLRLEPLMPAHAEEMFEPMSAARIYDYMPGLPLPSAVALRQRYLQLAKGRSADGSEQWLNWIVRLYSGQCAGFVQATIYPGLTGDFAFALAPEYWGRGLAYEASHSNYSSLGQ